VQLQTITSKLYNQGWEQSHHQTNLTHSIDYLCCSVFLLVKIVLDLMSNNQNIQFEVVEQT